MVVCRSGFDLVLERLLPESTLSLDTETFSLRPYHTSPCLFSLILGRRGAAGVEGYYFNFHDGYDGLAPDFILPREYLQRLKPLFEDPKKKFYIQKSNFDLHVLQSEGIQIAGEIFCTLVQGRVAYNEHMNYSLADSLERIGKAKDDRVEAWIADNKAFTVELPPGKTQKRKNKHFDQVPFDIIAPYGIQDAVGCFELGEHLEAQIAEQAKEFPPGKPSLIHASHIESRLAHTVHRMESRGVLIDRPYIARAIAYESDRSEKASLAFRRETGRNYQASPLLFAELFAGEKSKWAYTDKGNPSFESDALRTFENPAAKLVLEIRDTKSRLDFYNGFLYHADANDVVHPQFNSGGTRTFRFSSSEPNFQNMTSEDATLCRACKKGTEQLSDTCSECGSKDVEHPEFLVRRAIIPRPGFLFIMPDYKSVEYAMMLEYSKTMMLSYLNSREQPWSEEFFEVANKVAAGFDVHLATAEMMGVSRKYAKTLNFLLLYGGGAAKLAGALGVTLEEAVQLKEKYFRALPYVQHMIAEVTRTIRTRGWIRNWAGYKFHFPDRNRAFTGPNTLIQSGCAAVLKVAMNDVDETLKPCQSRLLMTTHDELVIEVAENEVGIIPTMVKERMEAVYPHKHIPLTVDMEYSHKSLGDKLKGFPV